MRRSEEYEELRRLRVEVERLKAERGEFSDVLHRATLAEAKIEAALAEIQGQRKRAGLPSTGPTPPGVLAMALRLVEEALTGGRE